MGSFLRRAECRAEVRGRRSDFSRETNSMSARKYWRVLIVPVVALLALTAANLNSGELLRALLLAESTDYVDGYSDARFSSVKVGDTTEVVLSKIGAPLRRGPWGDHAHVWFYSDQRTVTDNFWRRWLVLNAAGDRVAEIVADFWVD